MRQGSTIILKVNRCRNSWLCSFLSNSQVAEVGVIYWSVKYDGAMQNKYIQWSIQGTQRDRKNCPWSRYILQICLCDGYVQGVIVLTHLGVDARVGGASASWDTVT